eukprot:131093-Pyramimonas_sp.AAC.1
MSSAHLDRINCALSSQDIPDFCPRTGAPWPIADFGAPSDHCPVFLLLARWAPQGAPRIAS